LQLSIFFIEPTNNLVNNKSKANGWCFAINVSSLIHIIQTMYDYMTL
jgi:hypothetical protein